MIARCERPSNPSYANYGARGIKVCPRWRNSFEAFYADMGPRPGTGYSIERINCYGDYEPSNCCWILMERQNANRSTSVKLTYNGKTQCMADWAREMGIRRDTLRYRLQRGWSVEKALTTPVTQNQKVQR
jgi:hypothetical protein